MFVCFPVSFLAYLTSMPTSLSLSSLSLIALCPFFSFSLSLSYMRPPSLPPSPLPPSLSLLPFLSHTRTHTVVVKASKHADEDKFYLDYMFVIDDKAKAISGGIQSGTARYM